MQVTDHLDVEKVATREVKNLLTIARYQGQWTVAQSLKHQAEALGTEGPIMRQFDVAIERIETKLAELGAVKPEVGHDHPE
jgi:hypothetical protein